MSSACEPFPTHARAPNLRRLGGGLRQIKSRHYIFAEELRSGAEHADRQLVLGKTHALGQDDAEAVEK